eukprot:750038-Hanusia_phi.AAC.7
MSPSNLTIDTPSLLPIIVTWLHVCNPFLHGSTYLQHLNNGGAAKQIDSRHERASIINRLEQDEGQDHQVKDGSACYKAPEQRMGPDQPV